MYYLFSEILPSTNVSVFLLQGYPIWYLLLQNQQWKHKQNVQNVLKVYNKETRLTSVTSSGQVYSGWDLVFQWKIWNKYCCTVQRKTCKKVRLVFLCSNTPIADIKSPKVSISLLAYPWKRACRSTPLLSIKSKTSSNVIWKRKKLLTFLKQVSLHKKRCCYASC